MFVNKNQNRFCTIYPICIGVYLSIYPSLWIPLFISVFSLLFHWMSLKIYSTLIRLTSNFRIHFLYADASNTWYILNALPFFLILYTPTSPWQFNVQRPGREILQATFFIMYFPEQIKYFLHTHTHKDHYLRLYLSIEICICMWAYVYTYRMSHKTICTHSMFIKPIIINQ